MYQCQIEHDSFKELLKGKPVTWQVAWECLIQEGSWKASNKCRNPRHPDFCLCTIGGCTQAGRLLREQIPPVFKGSQVSVQQTLLWFYWGTPPASEGTQVLHAEPLLILWVHWAPFPAGSKRRGQESWLRLVLPSPHASAFELAHGLGQQDSHCWAWGSGDWLHK